MTEHTRPDLLNDYAEGLLDGSAASEVEAHIAGCARCAADVQAIRGLRSEAAALPASLDPGVDLRPAIRSAYRAGRGSRAGRLSRSAAGNRGRLMAMAALIAAVLASVPAVLRMVGEPAGTPAVADLPRGAATVLALDREYDRAADELRARLDGSAGLLPSDAVRILGRTLASLDRALAESRAALRADPASPILRELVLSHHRQRLDVLRQAAELAAEREEAT